MMFKKPKFWDYSKPNLISYLLLPFTILIIFRNFFSKKIYKKKFNNIKTICVGNIYIGGTGKTPLTLKIYEILKNKNFKVSTAKKFYSKQRDEQLLLNKNSSLIIERTRKKAIKQAINYKLDYLIFDDGIQDLNIEYDLKFVCFKAYNWIGNGQIIPSGPLREKITSLIKYDAVFLNGRSDNLDEIKNKIKVINSKIKIFTTSYEPININEFNLNKNFLVFSAIGNPIDFKNILINNKFNVQKELIFPDHFEYSNQDIEKIIKTAKEENLKIITTEKDFMKIDNKFKSEINFLKIDLLIDQENELIELIS